MESIEELGAAEMANVFRTGEAYEIMGGDDRIGFSPFETPQRRDALNISIKEVENKVLKSAVQKYGPEGFASSVTKAQLTAFQADKKLYNSFRSWKDNWEVISDAWDFRYTGEDVVTKYEKELVEWKDRFAKAGLFGDAKTPVKGGGGGGAVAEIAEAAPEQASKKKMSGAQIALLVMGGAAIVGMGYAYSRGKFL